MTTVREVPEFEKDVKKLDKWNVRYDIDNTFKPAIMTQIQQIRNHYPQNKYIHDLEIIQGHPGKEPIYKARKVRCKYTKTSTDLRIVFTYDPTTDEILLLEIYPKNITSRQNHNDDIIKKYSINLS